MATAAVEYAQQLAEDVARFIRNPVGFAYYIYPWGQAELEGSAGPRTWQKNILQAIKDHLTGPKRFEPYQVAVSSGHAIGKSALMGMILHWAMSTCEDCKVVITADTGTQLRTKTWPEVCKWLRLALNRDWFEVRAESITVRQSGHERTWRADRITWAENNYEAFAGLHNKGKRIVVMFDEASIISDKIWETTEGALTDENTEILWLAFGNPTRNTGRFRECWGRFAHRWHTFQIDSRNVEGTNKQQIAEWAEDYGDDSDFFRVRVKGEFPRTGENEFIPVDVVGKARRFQAEGFAGLPKVLSVDVARFGDDRTVVGTRQGRKARILAKWRGLDTAQVAMRVIAFIDEEQPDATVIDGDGIGAGVIDQLRHRGYDRRLFEFHGAEAANDSNAYFNARAEAWGLMRAWLMAGAEIPDDPELAMDLVAPTYGFSAKQQIQLERKQDMKKRGLASPDCADMLAMTFSVKVALPKPAPPPKYVYPGQVSQGWMG